MVGRQFNEEHVGLVDLIAGVTPTYNAWDTDPTDGADITDGDISTFCTTGNKVNAAAWDECRFEWDLGAFYNVICTGVGSSNATAGTPVVYADFYNGAGWVQSRASMFGSADTYGGGFGGVCSKVRLSLMSSQIATLTPNIRGFHVWRL